MKTLGKYLIDNINEDPLKKIIESAFDYDYDIEDDDEKIDEGLGSILGNISGKFNNFLRKIKGFGPKLGSVMTITAKSIVDIDGDEEQQKAKDLIASYDNCKDNDDIIKVNVKYLKENPDTESKFNTGLIASTIMMIRKSKLEESKKYEKELKDMLAKQDESIKKDLSKQIKNVEDDKPTETEGDTKSETTGDKEETQKKVDTTVSSDPIKQLASDAKINPDKLETAIWGMLTENVDKWNLEDEKAVIKGLSAIVCGVSLIKDEKFANEILNVCGVKNYKQFKEKIAEAIKDGQK